MKDNLLVLAGLITGITLRAKLNPDYCTMARRILYEASPLFA